MLEYMRLGGSIMWVIAALSVLALAVCILGYLKSHRK